MIKFRCLHCGQKIAVNDEGAGVVIPCPNCTDLCAVPSATTAEFCPRGPSPFAAGILLAVETEPPVSAPAPQPAPASAPAAIPPPVLESPPAESVPLELVAEPSAADAGQTASPAAPSARAWAVTYQLVQALAVQRQQLLTAQQAGTASLEQFEQRLSALQAQLQSRHAAAEQRIAELQRELTAATDHNRRLLLENLKLTEQARPTAPETPLDFSHAAFVQ